MNTLQASQPILDAIEKVMTGQWYARQASEEKTGQWTFVFVDSGTEEETTIEGVNNHHAAAVLRDMVAHAEMQTDQGEMS